MFDWRLLNDHLAALAAGAAVPVPIYDYNIYDRTDEVRMVQPAQIVVVEGILVLYDQQLRERFDLRVYIDTDADLRLIRRLERDVRERGRTVDSVITQYLATVRPSHEQFIEPSKRHADVIIPQGGLNRPALDVLLAQSARAGHLTGSLQLQRPRGGRRHPRSLDDETRAMTRETVGDRVAHDLGRATMTSALHTTWVAIGIGSARVNHRSAVSTDAHHERGDGQRGVADERGDEHVDGERGDVAAQTAGRRAHRRARRGSTAPRRPR